MRSAREAGPLCRQLFELTGNQAMARAGDLIVVRPAKIAFILLMAWVASRLLKGAFVPSKQL